MAALLKRWILGTHHGAVQPGQLDYYLDAFVFRFNRRSSAVTTDAVTYWDVVSMKRNPKKPR